MSVSLVGYFVQPSSGNFKFSREFSSTSSCCKTDKATRFTSQNVHFFHFYWRHTCVIVRNIKVQLDNQHKWSKFQTPKYFLCSANVLASTYSCRRKRPWRRVFLQNNILYRKGEMIMQLLHGFQLCVPIHQMFIISNHHITWTPQQSHFITIHTHIATIWWRRMFWQTNWIPLQYISSLRSRWVRLQRK